MEKSSLTALAREQMKLARQVAFSLGIDRIDSMFSKEVADSLTDEQRPT